MAAERGIEKLPKPPRLARAALPPSGRAARRIFAVIFCDF
jgi:hypothetical protein